MNLNFYAVYVNPSESKEAAYESLWKNEAIETADRLKTQHPNQTVIVVAWSPEKNGDEVIYEATKEEANRIEELKAEVARLTSLKNNENAEIAKARGRNRAALIEAQKPTIEAIRTAQRAIIAMRRSEAA